MSRRSSNATRDKWIERASKITESRPPMTTIIIDDVPDMTLASNQRGGLHHMERAQAVSIEFERAMWLFKAAFAGQKIERYEVPVTVKFTVRLPAKHRRDADNLAGACKVWLDALTMGRGKRDGIGLLWDDSPKWVKSVSYEINDTPGLVYTEIRIAPVEEAASA